MLKLSRRLAMYSKSIVPKQTRLSRSVVPNQIRRSKFLVKLGQEGLLFLIRFS